MVNSVLDVIAFVSPVAIALMSVVVGMKLAVNPQDQSHKYWWAAILLLGFICSAGTLWQQDRSKKEHADEIDNQKKANANLQSALDKMTGQFSAFELMLGQINQNGNLNTKEIANAMTTLAQGRFVQGSKPPNGKYLAIRSKLAHLLQSYNELQSIDCAPSNVGPAHSGAGHTPEYCNGVFNEWARQSQAYICESGDFDVAECTEFRWKTTPEEKLDHIKRLIAQFQIP